MERDWSLSGACHGLQSRTALHNPGCAISRKIFGKLQLICNQYFAKQILWVLEPCLRRRDLGWPKTP
jgi:hypothetical protein